MGVFFSDPVVALADGNWFAHRSIHADWLVGLHRHRKAFGSGRSGAIVWDEIVAFWSVLWLITPCGWLAQFAAFVLFRYFDIAKPGPVRWADQAFKGFGWRGGWGILFDDFVAAFCTLLVIALWRVI